jgi:hypothetical protein
LCIFICVCVCVCVYVLCQTIVEMLLCLFQTAFGWDERAVEDGDKMWLRENVEIRGRDRERY